MSWMEIIGLSIYNLAEKLPYNWLMHHIVEALQYTHVIYHPSADGGREFGADLITGLLCVAENAVQTMFGN
ncbi:MAG: hypothetical protein Nk1A_7210 [Endomicrobiia bacterium]|nr:MAG: hypothetical protein Nk1A_7210 [Endomicrobiia bacterium]